MKHLLFAAALAACNPSQMKPLPGQSLTPNLTAGPSTTACGIDVAADEGSPPIVRYRYAYDAFGRLAHATGTFATGPADSIDYTYDHLDHMTGLVQTRAGSTTRYTITAQYDSLGDLIDYTTEDREPTYYDKRHYGYSAFTELGMPAREVISILGTNDSGYQLDYDATGRIAHARSDAGELTTYTYDDVESRTVTIDTDGGAYHGLVVYDDQSRELSETWDGTAADVIASDRSYDYDGERLLKIVYRQGSTEAPHDLAVVEVDTLVYDCAVLRSTRVPAVVARTRPGSR